MRNEKAFSRDGFYRFVLEANLMLHRNVAESGRRIVSRWLRTHEPKGVIRILDLACGGAPISICNMTRHFDTYQFDYTGIDINPDQIVAAKSFEYPSNFRKIELHEGNAWHFGDLVKGQHFDIVFSGMNLHHGIPEEILAVMMQVKSVLAPNGLLISHDFFRPETEAYLRRPALDPETGEPFCMIPPEALSKIDTKNLPQFKSPGIEERSDWRQPFITKYRLALAQREAAQQGVEEIMAHVNARDYPVSINELIEIARLAGVALEQVPMEADKEPMKDYFCLLSGQTTSN